MKFNATLVIGILIMALFVSGCTQVADQQKDKSADMVDERLNVIVSILPQKAFVKAVGGDLVKVKELIPKGGSPATYEPKPSDLAAVENADIYFTIGHIPFEESHLDKLKGLNSNMKVVDTSVNVELRDFEDDEHHDEHGEEEEHGHEDEEDHSDEEEHADEEDHEDEEHGDDDVHEEDHHEDEDSEHEDEEDHHDHHHEGTDPHIWLAPMQVKVQVDTIVESLVEADPKNADVYQSNAEKFKAELDQLHEDIEAEFSNLDTHTLMVFHPAWGYFADEYGLEQVAIEEEGKDPTAEQLQELIELAEEEEIKVIFVQSQFNQAIAESIAEEIGAVIVSIDPLSDDYLNNLGSVAETIAESLNS